VSLLQYVNTVLTWRIITYIKITDHYHMYSSNTFANQCPKKSSKYTLATDILQPEVCSKTGQEEIRVEIRRKWKRVGHLSRKKRGRDTPDCSTQESRGE
jgi:hypothetical protein